MPPSVPVRLSPSFKEWFGDSKVKNDNDDPLLLMHGTPYKFSNHSIGSFDENIGLGSAVDSGFFGTGNYFTTEINLARKYALKRSAPVGFITFSYCNSSKILTFLTTVRDLCNNIEAIDEINFSKLPSEISETTKNLFFQKMDVWKNKKIGDAQRNTSSRWCYIEPSEHDVAEFFLSESIKEIAINEGYLAAKGTNPLNGLEEYVVYDENSLLTVGRKNVKIKAE